MLKFKKHFRIMMITAAVLALGTGCAITNKDDNDDRIEATGVYIGGTFYGATAASAATIEDRLDVLLEPARATASLLNDSNSDANNGKYKDLSMIKLIKLVAAGDLDASIELTRRNQEIKVKFVREVEYVPGMFSPEAIIPLEALITTITAPDAKPQILYKARAGERALDIAAKNGISVQALQRLNPSIDLSYDQPFKSGNTLVVAENEPLLRAKIYRQIIRTERVYPETSIIWNSAMPNPYILIVREGQEGLREVTKESEYDSSGRIISEIEFSSKIITPAEHTVILVGIKDASAGGEMDNLTPLLWPVGPGYQHVSRGWRPEKYHFAMDFACKEGTEVYASDSGIVVAAAFDKELGNYIVIDHRNGMYTKYLHCSELIREVDDTVKRGDLIASVGSTGTLCYVVLIGPIYKTATPIDPASLVGYNA